MTTHTRTVLIARHFGGPEVLEFLSEPAPGPGPGEVLVQVRAAGVNPIDTRRMTGEFGTDLPQTFGAEFAGTIQAVGADTAPWQVGDDVLGSGVGVTHATHIVVPARHLVAKPESLSWEIAGSLAAAGQTAATILRELAVPAGGSLLVHGGSGGVGSITVQLAVGQGATVVATASAANQDYLRALGAIPVEYGPGLADRIAAVHPEPFTASIDMIGNREATETSLALVAPEGAIVTIAGRQVDSPRVRVMRGQRSREDLQRLVDGVTGGTLRWEVSRSYPLLDAVTAYRDMLSGHTRGKSVLTIPPQP